MKIVITNFMKECDLKWHFHSNTLFVSSSLTEKERKTAVEECTYVIENAPKETTQAMNLNGKLQYIVDLD